MLNCSGSCTPLLPAVATAAAVPFETSPVLCRSAGFREPEAARLGVGAQSLLVAMEQGEVSVAKGGTVAAMPARASVLAAANPVGGTYNRAQTVLENLNMPGPLLSRFDLVCAAPLPSS